MRLIVTLILKVHFLNNLIAVALVIHVIKVEFVSLIVKIVYFLNEQIKLYKLAPPFLHKKFPSPSTLIFMTHSY